MRFDEGYRNIDLNAFACMCAVICYVGVDLAYWELSLGCCLPVCLLPYGCRRIRGIAYLVRYGVTEILRHCLSSDVVQRGSRF